MSGVRTPGRTCVLVVAAGADWESRALAALSSRPGLVVLKRCMDVTDLLAVATSGQAQAAVLSADAPDVDAAAIDHLARHAVSTVAVVPTAGREEEHQRLARIGVRHVVAVDELDHLPDVVLEAVSVGPAAEAGQAPEPAVGPDGVPGSARNWAQRRAIAVWGPAGAPGRTTVALGIAGELSRRGADPLVVDADPWGGSVAQHLGVLDEVSGVLACARLAVSGELADRFVGVQRRVAGLRVVTGLPRPDRWVEVRSGTVEQVVGLARAQGPSVLDTGFCLEEDPGAGPTGRTGRNTMTLEALGHADTLVVVGTADPVGLSRLARGLVELREVTDGRPVHVVVNRMRSTLGWSEDDVAGMVGGFTRVDGVHFLPDDRGATDRALLTGRTLAEVGDSSLSRAFAVLVEVLEPELAGGRQRRGLRRRRAGTAHRR